MSRRKTVLLVLGVLFGCALGSVLIRFLAASREPLDTTVRVDGVSDMGDGRYLVKPLPAPVEAQEIEIQAITRYPFGYAVIEPREGQDPLRPPPKPTAVRCAIVKRERHARVVLAYGKLAADRDARLAVETSGRVLRYAVAVGAHVEEGDPLLELDPSDAQLRLETAEAEVRVATSQKAQAATNLSSQRRLLDSAAERLAARAEDRARWLDLREKSVASQERVDQADEVWRLARAAHEQLLGAERMAAAELTAAEAALARAEVARKVAARDREQCTLRAPYGGEVAERLVGVGDFVMNGTPVVRMVDQRTIRVRLHVRPGEATWLRAGAKATVRIPSLRVAAAHDGPADGSGAFSTEGTVEGVSAVSDPQTQKVAVDVVLPNPGSLRAGLFARVELDAGHVDDAVWIPDTAVVATQDGTSVYLLEGDVAQRRELELGARLGEGRLLRSGREDWGAGPWELVTDGTALLFDGAPIRRVE